MNAIKSLLKSQIGWALIAGAAIGTAATVGFLSSRTLAVANPTESPISGTTLETLHALDQAGVDLVQQVSPSVVFIRTNTSEGSGVVYRQDGYIMTNAHVVQGQRNVQVYFNDGREASGRVIMDTTDSFNDIAVVKVDRTGLKPAKFADSALVKPGQIAVAFGAPFGLQESVSFGHVSAVGRMNAIPDPSASLRARVYTNMIQTDAAINPGNSGGPLLNYKGEVIGINSAINSTTGYNTGVGFAIPANTAKLIADKLIEDGKISRAFLGLQPDDLKPFEKEELGVASGSIVRDVTEGAPADQAGIEVGDVIVRIGSVDVRSHQDVWNAMLVAEPNKSLPIEVVRDGQRKSLSAKPVARTAELDARNNGLARGGEMFEPMPEPNAPAPEFDSQQVRLGVTVRELREQEKSLAPGGSGVLVTAVEPGSPAARAGVRAGHVITQLGDRKVASADDLQAAINAHSKGDQAALTFGRIDPSGNLRVSSTITF